MPCPFAPLLGLAPTLLAIPYLVTARLRRVRRLANEKFEDQEIADANEQDVSLSKFGHLRAPLQCERLQSLEFYGEKTPHFREQHALHCGQSGEAKVLLFSEQACPEHAQRAAKIFIDAGIGLARIKDSELQLRVKDSDSFRHYGLEKILSALRAL